MSDKYTCLESDRDVRSVVYKPNGEPLTNGEIVGELNALAVTQDNLNESIEYAETVDAMLDGIVPSRKDAKDPTSQQLWLKERLELLLYRYEATSEKLSDVWMWLDGIARSERTDIPWIKGAAETILRRQQCPGWKEDYVEPTDNQEIEKAELESRGLVSDGFDELLRRGPHQPA